MKRVLIITGILPNQYIKKKKDENDVILVTEDEIKKRYHDIEFKYIFTVTDTNLLLSWLSKKWKSYYQLKKSGSFNVKGRVVPVFPIIILPKKTGFRKYLFNISFWLNRKKIDRIIKEFSPTILHAHKIDIDGYMAKKISEKYNIPYILTLRNARKYNLDKLEKDVVNGAEARIALSPVIKSKIAPYTQKEITIIPHGINEELFHPIENLRINKHTKFITIARLLDWKNIDRIIEAFSKVEGEFSLDIYGKGPEYNNLQALITQLNLEKKIKLNGFIEYNKIPEVLGKSDVFVLLSFPETFGRVYIEAMSCGLPIIASKGAGMDGIIMNGEEGFLINHKDDQAILKIINSFLENPNQLNEMSFKAIELSKRFSWRSISKQLYALYH